MRPPSAPLVGALAALALAGCTSGGSGGPQAPADLPPLPWPAAAIARAPEPADNPGTPEKIALGELLFYDPILSTDKAVACVTCHSEIWGMADGLALSVGVDGTGPAGPGREGPNVTRRNAPTLWNVAYRPLLFADGRTASLEEQVLGPLVEAQRAPPASRLARAGHGGVDLGLGPDGVRADEVAVGGVEGVERLDRRIRGGGRLQRCGHRFS